MVIFPVSVGNGEILSYEELVSRIDAIEYVKNVQHESLESQEEEMLDDMWLIREKCEADGYTQPDCRPLGIV